MDQDNGQPPASDNVEKLDDRRRKTMKVAMIELPAPGPKPQGPFTVSVSDAQGKMFEVIFPDYTGELPEGDCVMGTAGPDIPETLCNLLTGAMRVFLGCK